MRIDRRHYLLVIGSLLLGFFIIVGFLINNRPNEEIINQSVQAETVTANRPGTVQNTVDLTNTPTTTALPSQTPSTPPHTATVVEMESETPTLVRPMPQAATMTATPTITDEDSSPIVKPGNIIVDHHSVDLFDQIPEQYLEAAEKISMIFIDQSVGNNISDGLDCLSHSSMEEAPGHCKRTDHFDPNFSVSPAVLNWSRPGGYNRENWDFRFYEGSDCSYWYGQINCFFEMIMPIVENYDVVSYQFSYFTVVDDSTINEQPGGFFWDNDDFIDVYDLEDFEAEHPEKEIIYWTTSLARSIGTQTSQSFNDQMRQYALENNKVLFDVADILSHAPDGQECFDNRDGIEYNNNGKTENYADDGFAYPAICPHYTTEIDGGHLGSVSAGKIRLAKAFWVLMAQLAGWEPNSN